MQRVKAILSYDGSQFYGFQRQKESTRHPTVANLIEEALKKLNISSPIMGAGRTDAGVHAFAQVIHFDIPLFWNDLEKLLHCLNTCLHPFVHIKSLHYVQNDFHARFSAKKRLYRYIMYDDAYQPHFSNYALHISSLDINILNEYAQYFVGTHNFGFFKKMGGAPTGDKRTIFKAGAYRFHHFIVLYFMGDAFLRSQVRMMTKILLDVTSGHLCKEAMIEQIQMKTKHSSLLAPASGLYLSRIYY